MVAVMAPPAKDLARRRKTHKKSRQGCNNCKLRRVKCDEAKPRCRRCVDYGVDCNYESTYGGTLQLAGENAFVLEKVPTLNIKTPSQDTTSISMINSTLAGKYVNAPLAAYRISADDWAVLRRFQLRTVCTIATASTYKTFQNEIFPLAFTNPYLMHVLLTLTLMHDRYIAKENTLSVAEAFHRYQGTALFNQTLARPIKDQERDAVWATAALLGAIVFGATEVTTPEESWPLSSPSCSDLDWLTISNGKREVARLAYPNGPGSVFYLATRVSHVNLLEKIPNFKSDFEAFPPGFIEYCGLAPGMEVIDNPYHRAAAMLNALLPETCNHATILMFFTFMGHVPTEYRDLLQAKDPKALLLLAYWFAKLCEYDSWWVAKRVYVECQAVCIYLTRYHWQNFALLKLLKFPISRCGLAGSTQVDIKHWMFRSLD